MESKSYKVGLVDEKELEKDVVDANKKVDEDLKSEFQTIYKEMEKMEIQQKIFFVDRVMMEFVENSNLPSFYIKALLSRLDDFVKDKNSIPSVKEVKKFLPYVG